MTIEDEPLAKLRRELILAAVEGARVAISSVNDDLDCVVVGRVVKVTSKYAFVASSRNNESPIPLASIVTVRRFDEPRAVPVSEEPSGDAA